MKCKICKNKSEVLFKTQVLSKYDVKYYRCTHCGFIQTEKPHWLDESYQSAITDLDVGLVNRNIEFSKMVFKIITSSFEWSGDFLDYAGGYGMFTRIMRDRGLSFFHYDKYCQNLFAQNLDLKTPNTDKKFEALTAFEVFEHLSDPMEEIESLLKLSDSIIFSTELVPKKDITKSDDWWYFTPQTGQHIAFYSLESLEFIAKKFNINFYSNGSFLHILSRNKFKANPFAESAIELELKSLTQDDFEFAKHLLETKKSKISDYVDFRKSFSSIAKQDRIIRKINKFNETKNILLECSLSSTELKLISGVRKLKHFAIPEKSFRKQIFDKIKTSLFATLK